MSDEDGPCGVDEGLGEDVEGCDLYQGLYVGLVEYGCSEISGGEVDCRGEEDSDAGVDCESGPDEG